MIGFFIAKLKYTPKVEIGQSTLPLQLKPRVSEISKEISEKKERLPAISQ